MTRYPRHVDRECLPCPSRGLDEIQMIDGGALDLHQHLVACNRRRGTSLNANCPPYSNTLTAFMRWPRRSGTSRAHLGAHGCEHDVAVEPLDLPVAQIP